MKKVGLQFKNTDEIAKKICNSDSWTSRSFGYAMRKPLEHCDQPAILLAEIPNKYIKSVNHNGYEVVVSKSDVAQLNKVALLAIENVTTTEMLLLPRKSEVNKFTDPELRKRLNQALDRLEEANRKLYSF